jgi:hypothetical protein
MASINVYVRMRPHLPHEREERTEKKRILLEEETQQVKYVFYESESISLSKRKKYLGLIMSLVLRLPRIRSLKAFRQSIWWKG